MLVGPLEEQDLSRAYLAHQELDSVVIINIIIILVGMCLHWGLPEAWHVCMCMCDVQVWDSFWSGHIPGTGCQSPGLAPHHH